MATPPRPLHIAIAAAGVLLTPGRALPALAAAGRASDAAWIMLAFGGAYGLFTLALHLGGHAPSRVTLPIDPASYYLVETFFLPPLFVALWLLFGALAHGGARLLGGAGPLRATLAVLGFTYAVPCLVAFLLPDVIVYAAAGHHALGPAMRYYAPIALVWLLWLSARGLAAATGLRPLRAAAVTVLAFVLHSPLAGVAIR